MPDDEHDAILGDAREWVALARTGGLPAVEFREAEIGKVLGHLERSRSVVLVGPAGVGKSSVLVGVAQALARRQPNRPMFEFSTSGLLVGTRYLGEWQTKLAYVARAIIEAHGVFLIGDLPKLAFV